MPYIVAWTAYAESKLFEIFDYLNDFDSDIASAVFKKIVVSSKKLAEWPHLGRPANMLESGYQELLVSSGASGYILLYEVVGETIFIHSVRHQKQANY